MVTEVNGYNLSHSCKYSSMCRSVNVCFAVLRRAPQLMPTSAGATKKQMSKLLESLSFFFFFPLEVNQNICLLDIEH